MNICNELCFCTFYKKEGNVGTKADDDDKCNYAEENAKKAAMPNTLPDSMNRLAPRFCPQYVAMVTPSVSMGCVTNICTLLAAVIEARIIGSQRIDCSLQNSAPNGGNRILAVPWEGPC